MWDRAVAVEDLGDFLECGAPGLRVHKVDEDEFDSDPQSVEQGKVPVVGKTFPGDRVGLTASWLARLKDKTSIRQNLPSDSEDGLDGDVHNHQTLGT